MGYKWKKEAEDMTYSRQFHISTVCFSLSFFLMLAIMALYLLAAMCCNTARHSVILARRGTLNGNGPGIGSGWAAAAGRLQ
jgi:nitrate reductase gamma subunit